MKVTLVGITTLVRPDLVKAYVPINLTDLQTSKNKNKNNNNNNTEKIKIILKNEDIMVRGWEVLKPTKINPTNIH